MVDRKMTLKELAENVGISYVNLSKIKTGKVQGVRFSTLEAICETLDCQPGDILEFVHEDHPDAAGREGGGNDEEDGAEGKESLRDRHRRLKDDLILEAANRRCRHDTRDERSFRKKVMPAPE